MAPHTQLDLEADIDTVHPQILIVDDNDFNSLTLQELLSLAFNK